MPRPRHCLIKNVKFEPEVSYFKPLGVPIKNLEVVEITLEEIEAYRLRHFEKLEQIEAGKQMKTSTSTYQRILYRAYDKIADALINGKAIKIIRHN